VHGGSHDGSGRIAAQQLTKQFGPVTAVRDLTFTVEPGTVTGFLGPNGAGKTTTLRMLVGLVRPTAGVATINGVPFNQLSRPATVVGAVLEAQGFHPGRSARRHLRVYAAAIGVPDQRAEQVLQLVGLDVAGDRAVGGFSLGMRQRLALATALLGDPPILILDEPANGLDPEGIAWLRMFLRAFAAGGRTVLVSSHLLAEVEQTIDHVVIISQGRTMYNGPLDDLRQRQQSRVLVRTSSPDALGVALHEDGVFNFEPMPDGRLAINSITGEQVADIALRARIPLSGVEEERANLEQLYFQLTGSPYPQAPADPGLAPGYRPPPPGYQPPPGYGPSDYGPPTGLGPASGQQYPPLGYTPQGLPARPGSPMPDQQSQPMPDQQPAQPQSGQDDVRDDAEGRG
jgi:ABC-2 type transport system ATP-binding protein